MIQEKLPEMNSSNNNVGGSE